VIAGSILLAFSIDAAWERHQASAARAELVDALQLDFETTRDRLDMAILQGDSLVARGSKALRLIADGDPPPPIDSLRFLLVGFFRDLTFVPALSAYEASVGEGGIGSLGSRAVLEADATFRRSRRFYDAHFSVSTDQFYRGTALELRRELGSLSVLMRAPDCLPPNYGCPYPRGFERNASELLEYMSAPHVYGALENTLNANINIVRSLRGMRAATDDLLDALAAIEGGAS
jgi:hypothetical protein